MKNIFPLFFLACFLVAASFLSAQNPFSFTNANSKFASTAFHSGNCVSVVDMDGDGMDDIARLNGSNDLYYTLQRTNQTFNNIHAVSTGSGYAWGMVVGDANNDGIRDVAVGFNGSAKLVTPNTSLTSFPIVTLPNSNFFLQNMNFADINNDGWIDLFGCNDVGASVTWGNNGSGSYPSTSNLITANNFASAGSTGPYDNSGNYGSIWTDVNNDGHIDLYIAHCRQNTNANCVNRLDELYMNDGNNNYILDTAIAPYGRGLRNYNMTWTASFEDIDNDGDLDCLLTENDVPTQLFLNDGNGYFSDRTSTSGISVNITPYQSKMEDLDNDGYVDIIISGDDSRVFHNNHDNTFTLISGLFDNNHMLSFATGDLNHDGKIDLYSSYGTVYNNPTNTDDVLWLNTTDNGNHFITFNLQGTISNRDALGARVEIYGAWGKQIREVRAGESYGTTNSFQCHFGLGTATVVDSAIIRWPKGLVTKLYNRPADQFITVIEGQCSSPDNIIAFNGPSVLCAGQSVTMSAPAGYSYLWSDGTTAQTDTTSTSGEFTVKVTDNSSGCSSISKMVTILSQPDETPTITASTLTTFCEGQSVAINGSFSAGGYIWSNGDTTQNIIATQPGNYTLTVHGVCADFTSQPIMLSSIPSHIINTVGANICANDTSAPVIEATATGTTYWYDSLAAGNLLSGGTDYAIPPLNSTTTYYVESRDTLFGISGSTGKPDNSGGGGYFTGDQYETFDVLSPVILQSVTVYTNSSKNRTIELRNSAGTLLQSLTVNIAQGTQTVDLNFGIPVGTDYRLGWAAGSSPDWYRNNGGVSYPYTLNNLLSVTNSSAGTQYYYAFYNWQVEAQPKTCESVRVPVTATVKPLPVASVTANDTTTFCIGSSVDLTAATADSYFWNNDSTTQTITVTQSGNYSVQVTAANGCSAASSPIVVTVNPNPVVSLSGLNTLYNSTDAAVTITGTPAGGTFSGTGVVGNSFDPSVAGIGGPYTVTYNFVDSNGCNASSSLDVTVQLNSSIQQIEGLSVVNIFPNPNNGDFLLSMKSKMAKTINIEITNYLGQKIFEDKNVSVTNTFNLPIGIKTVAKGLYHLTIVCGNQQNTYKVVVQ